ncbi:MAG: hypothetical protein AB2533_06940, partial [Candidatus Thiodiazotropha endolucinida]
VREVLNQGIDFLVAKQETRLDSVVQVDWERIGISHLPLLAINPPIELNNVFCEILCRFIRRVVNTRKQESIGDI